MRTISRRTTSLALGAAALALGARSAAAATYTLRYSDIGPPRGPRAEMLKWWAAEIEKQTNGQVKVEFFWSQALVKGKDTLKAVGSGLAETGSILGIYTPAELPIWNYANTPFGIRNIWVGMRTWHELRQTVPELRKETEKHNVHILLNFSTGPVDLLSRMPIRSTKEIAGKKVRTTGGWTQVVLGLGATPVDIGFGELYQALERGTVDATINYIPFVKSYKHFEVAGHLTETEMGQVLGYGAGINLRLWKQMPQDVRDKITRISDEYMDRYAKAYLEDAKKTKAELIAGIDGKKVQFYELPDADRAEWEKQAAPFTDKWMETMKAKGFDAKAFLATFEKTREKYEKELKTNGLAMIR
jgi:TRAP-type C4-dicarboxylate transport system substrate-binding protein